MVIPVFEDTNCDVCGCVESRELIAVRGSAYHECTRCGLIYARPMLRNVTEVNEEQYQAKLDFYAAKMRKKRGMPGNCVGSDRTARLETSWRSAAMPVRSYRLRGIWDGT